ncbi:MAG: hypothetical protein R2709_14250 [Marmoricola sp.]
MLAGAVHIPLAELVGRTDELDPTKPVLSLLRWWLAQQRWSELLEGPRIR